MNRIYLKAWFEDPVKPKDAVAGMRYLGSLNCNTDPFFLSVLMEMYGVALHRAQRVDSLCQQPHIVELLCDFAMRPAERSEAQEYARLFSDAAALIDEPN